MTQNDELDAKIAEAWKVHYGGQNDSALAKFQELAQEYPNHEDVLWGLGLCYRKVGDYENALQAFDRVKNRVTELLDAEPEEYERYLMLKRMVTQQIDQMRDFLQ